LVPHDPQTFFKLSLALVAVLAVHLTGYQVWKDEEINTLTLVIIP
jgi:hypothetical protein